MPNGLRRFHHAYWITALTLMIFVTGCPATAAAEKQNEKQPEASEVDLCSLLRDPSAFTGHLVRVQAFVDSDLIERTMLSQDGCIHGGIGLSTSKAGNRPIALVEDDGYRQYLELRLRFRILEEKHKRVHGTFEGIFVFRQNMSPAGILYLHKVTDLQVRPAATTKPSH
jgi:hypothetical protein